MADAKRKIDKRDFSVALANCAMSTAAILNTDPRVKLAQTAVTAAGAVWKSVRNQDSGNVSSIVRQIAEVIDAAFKKAVVENCPPDIGLELQLSDEDGKRLFRVVDGWLDTESLEGNAGGQEARKNICEGIRTALSGAVRDGQEPGKIHGSHYKAIPEDDYQGVAKRITDALFSYLEDGIQNNPVLEACYARRMLIQETRKISERVDEIRQDTGETKRDIGEIRRDTAETKQGIGEIKQDTEEIKSLLGDLKEGFTKKNDTYGGRVLNPDDGIDGSENLLEKSMRKDGEGAEDDAISDNEAIHIRHLADGLWINWKTGCLAGDMAGAARTRREEGSVLGRAAIVHTEEGSALGNAVERPHNMQQPEVQMPDEKKPDLLKQAVGCRLPVFLTHAELRLLSVLVQGEGTVVSFKELYRRVVLMHEDMARIEGKSDAGYGDDVGDNDVETKREDLFRALESLFRDDGRSLEEAGGDEEKRKVDDAVRKLCERIGELGRIICPAENGKGYYIRLAGLGSECNANSRYFTDKKIEKEDWSRLNSDLGKDAYNKDTPIWLRRYYADVCGSFEGNITNTGGGTSGRDIFGNYKMVRAYVNGYAAGEDSVEADALLDYVEKWYHGVDQYKEDSHIATGTRLRQSGEDMYGRVMVLHGQPGDGKTTFCKKAVYAHCFEGWLQAAPHVLRASLNPVDSDGAIISGNRLRIGNAICIYRSETGEGYDGLYPCLFAELPAGTLVILDGYDELVGDLNSVTDVSNFMGFYEKAQTIAVERKWNIIITSRSMCIEREIRESFKNEGAVEFAPMQYWRQDLMIERMIELDKTGGKGAGFAPDGFGTVEGRTRLTELEKYHEDVLLKLREKEESEKEEGKSQRARFGELLEIPALYRMLVTVRFRDIEQVENAAGLYGKLFHQLISFRVHDEEKEKDYLEEYEEIAARIFNYNENICPYDEINDKRELVYHFLTKSDGQGNGRLGFLHGSFRQYFLARYIVSSIQNVSTGKRSIRRKRRGIVETGGSFGTGGSRNSRSGMIDAWTDDNSKEAFYELMSRLSARRIEEPLVWQLVEQIAAIKGNGKKEESIKGDPFSEDPIRIQDIKNNLRWLNEENAIAEGILGGSPYGFKPEETTAEPKRLSAVENAIFNMMNAFAAMERGCHLRDSSTESIRYCGEEGYDNIASLLYRGGYAGINLGEADFGGNALEEKTVRRGEKPQIRVQRTDFGSARFSRAKLNEADLQGVIFHGADLSEASLSGAFVRGANFEEADLYEATLDGIRMTWQGEDSDVADVPGKDLESDYFKVTSFKGANLGKASLKKAVLYDTHFEGADLREAILKDAHLENAHFEGANLEDADLTGAILDGAHFEGANLKGACLREAKLRGATFARACLEGVDLWRVALEDTHFEDAHMEGAILEGAVIERTVPERSTSGNTALNSIHLERASLIGAYLGRNDGSSDIFLTGVDLSGTILEDAFLSESQYRFAKQAGALGLPDETPSGYRELPPGLSFEDIRRLGGEEGRQVRPPVLNLREAEIIPFGRYYQEKGGEKKPLLWRILRREYDKVLIVTERLIDCKAYNDEFVDITWEDSTLRRWMNNRFFYEAFNPEERARVVRVRNQNPDNERYGTEGGRPTWDRVFALSIDEASTYFKDREDRRAAPTPYAKAGGCYVDDEYKTSDGAGTGWWWLRSPGGHSDFAAHVLRGGGVYEDGNNVVNFAISVRPALWLNL